MIAEIHHVFHLGSLGGELSEAHVVIGNGLGVGDEARLVGFAQRVACSPGADDLVLFESYGDVSVMLGAVVACNLAQFVVVEQVAVFFVFENFELVALFYAAEAKELVGGTESAVAKVDRIESEKSFTNRASREQKVCLKFN